MITRTATHLEPPVTESATEPATADATADAGPDRPAMPVPIHPWWHRLSPDPTVLRDRRFWLFVALVAVLAATHFVVDAWVHPVQAFPEGVPVSLLLVLAGYAAVRWGLTGALASTLVGTILWVPDLLLPHDAGHAGSDAVSLTIAGAASLLIGYHVDSRRRALQHAAQAVAEQHRTEQRYRQLVESNPGPILFIDGAGTIADANAAGRRLMTDAAVLTSATSLSPDLDPKQLISGRMVRLTGNGHDYRLNTATIITGPDQTLTQVLLEDVTLEAAEQRRTRRFAHLLLAAQEDERRRVAHELHDEPIQVLIHLARTLEPNYRPGTSAWTDTRSGTAREQVLTTIDQLRRITRGLRPPALDLGLDAALRTFITDIADGYRCALSLTGTTGTSLGDDTDLAVFRIISEATNNALRHSGATHIDITLERLSTGLAVQVTDNGHGFDTATTEQPTGLGLLGIRERAQLLNADIDLYSSPDGTTLSLHVPEPTTPSSPPPAALTSPTRNN